MNGMITASTTMVKEREAGTLEQLLMTPVRISEIIVAKIAPPFVLLGDPGDDGAARDPSVLQGAVQRQRHACWRSRRRLCLLCGIGLGTAVATLTKSAQQAQLASFFIMPPHDVAVRRDDAGRGHAELAAARGPSSTPSTTSASSRGGDDQGQRLRRAVAEPARAAGFCARADVGQRVALPANN